MQNLQVKKIFHEPHKIRAYSQVFKDFKFEVSFLIMIFFKCDTSLDDRKTR